MNETPQIADNRTEENRIAGTLGAFLFALAGGLVYFALWQVGFIAAICGAIAVICAMKGYKLFAKKESLYGVVTSVVVSVLVIAIAWYFCLAFDVYDAYKEWYAAGEVEAPVSLLEALLGAHVFSAGSGNCDRIRDQSCHRYCALRGWVHLPGPQRNLARQKAGSADRRADRKSRRPADRCNRDAGWRKEIKMQTGAF